MIKRWLFAVGLLLGYPASALAQCTFTITPVSFGNVNVITGGQVDITATLNISCSGLAFLALRICPSIGAGTGGATATARRMLGPGGALLNYQLYQDAARTVVWGSYTWGLPGTPPTIDVPLALGGVNTNRTIFARVFSGQTTAPPGNYVSNFTAAHTDFVYGQAGLTACPNLLLPQQAHPTFAVTASVPPTCLLTTQDVDFGTHGVLTSSIDAAGQLTARCTATTSYAVGLNGGNANAAPTARKMSNGAMTVTYGLYRDTARSLPWGDAAGTTLAGTGTGTNQFLPVYGRVPPQATPPAGIYTDTILATITY